MSGPARQVLPKRYTDCLSGSVFSLRGFRVGAAQARRMFRDPRLSNYISRASALDLTGTRVGDEGLEALAHGPIAAGLNILRLTDSALTDASLYLLDRFPNLEVLDLADNALGPAGARALAETAAATRVRDLDLSGTGIGSEGLAHLRRRLTARALTVTDCVLDASLGGGPPHVLQPTEGLFIGGNPLGEAGARALSAWEARPRLLGLPFTDLDDTALAVLAAAGLPQAADYVDLRGNALSPSVLAAVAWREGAVVKLDAARIDWDDYDAIASTHPQTRFSLNAVAPGIVLLCPYCGLRHDPGALRCSRCRADLTRDASTEVPEDHHPEPAQRCPHCDGTMPEFAIRCGSCQSWTPTVEVG